MSNRSKSNHNNNKSTKSGLKAKVWSGFGYYGVVGDESNTAFTAFPSIRTEKPLTPVQVGDVLFFFNEPQFKHIFELMIFLKFLATKDFGLIDFLGFLFPKAKKEDPKNKGQLIDDNNKIADDFELSAVNIIQFLASLVVTKVEDGITNQKVTIGSRIRPEYSMTLYAAAKLSPQEANDVAVYYYSKPKGLKRTADEMASALKDGRIKIKTTLGYKVLSPQVTVKCGDRQIQMRTIGLNGALYGAGEHLEKNEAEDIKKKLDEEKESIEEGIPLKLSARDAMCERAENEELGLKELKGAHRFLVGVHTTPRRDLRYVTHEFEGYVFGFEDRPSMSVLIAVLVNIEQFSPDIKDPSDAEECSKPRLVDLNTLVDGFQEYGRFRPAFPMHVQQLKYIVEKMPTLLTLVP
jgi:hypothetical protein